MTLNSQMAAPTQVKPTQVKPTQANLASLGARELHPAMAGGMAMARAEFDPGVAAGTIDIYDIHPGVSVAVSDFVSHGPEMKTVVDKDVVKLNFQMAGGGAFTLEGDRAFSVASSSACIVHQIAGMTKTELYAAEAPQRAVTLFCDITYLSEALGDAGAGMPSPLAQLLAGRNSDFFALGFAPDWELMRAADALLRAANSRLRWLEIQARGFDLLLQFFRRVEDLERRSADHPTLSAADRNRVDLVRQTLEARFDEPLTMTQLARQAGVNESKLSELFKARFGLTVFECLRKVRMERAQRLLQDTDLPVTQIALEVGYEHPANFATAFKRSFGATPRAFRSA
ncbi:MAG: AraC family transcriptional regulator [Caulobacteraceae bacterium]|nr:AraC family transcriptional regulator [Caulobacteraceae bacterium]